MSLRALPALLAVALLNACAPADAPPGDTTWGEGEWPQLAGPPASLTLAQPVPGVADATQVFRVTGAGPGETVHVVYSTRSGSTTVPGCPGAVVDLDQPKVLGSVVADASGSAALTVFVPSQADGRTGRFQAVELGPCTVSNQQVRTFGSTVQTCYPGLVEDFGSCASLLDDNGSLGPDYDYPPPIGNNYQPPVRYLELAQLDPATRVAPNFRLDELAQEWKGPYAVVQVHGVERLQDLRDELGVLNITSGYRSPGYNAGVGGAVNSRHMYGDGFDISPGAASLAQLEAACYAHGAGWVGVYASWVHCDWRDDAQEPEFFDSVLQMPAPDPDAVSEHPAWIEVTDDGALTADAHGFDCGEPLREWIARDAAGRVIDTATGALYVPPAAAVEVEVTVGGRATGHLRLDREAT